MRELWSYKFPIKTLIVQNYGTSSISSLRPRSRVTADILGENNLLNAENSAKIAETKPCA